MSANLFKTFSPYTIPDQGTRRLGFEDMVAPCLDRAVAELQKRREDDVLRTQVEEYLNHDIPEYFEGEPVLYLARHIASPTIQTLRFFTTMRKEGMKTVVGQDPKDIFVSHNQLKAVLGKLPVVIGLYENDGVLTEQFQNVTILDFNESNGKKLSDLTTTWGEPLVDFHNDMLRTLGGEHLLIEDDSEWTDRYERGDLLAEYKKLLALFVYHGIMFEDYPMEDSSEEERFVVEILRPAVEHIESVFGVRPLIAPLNPAGPLSTAFWEGYPPEVLDIVQERIKRAE